MLDRVTKKSIDDLRNILVGKIPSPQSQVEQITTGLIYKFMYDMDNEAIEMGGVPSFFIDEYEKYSWKHLFNTKLGGVDKVKLYSDAIENLYNNPHAPSIFREIFKNSFLPFKDPTTLNMFLKEINKFHYSHSEKLGDAFEYLLSFMGSQGDAGQFRTPRHIIDFIVEIINPQKNETILDPACGTAGFLISSFKHILKQNTNTRIGDNLNASERKHLSENLVGYDISPDMTRISLVNMYLHQFTKPQISEYDTLSSDAKWNEYFDVILANPPFFSPTGGIKPHSRFGVKSTRAEVLFVDYIMEHLKPNGRAGIIVPEGIIFQTGRAYQTLRKKIINDSLIGVISMPAGVFQPYSGVKTTILILDKKSSREKDSIFFEKVENDGFSLGAQRKKIIENDLPKILKKINDGSVYESAILKKEILNSKDISLNFETYKLERVQSKYPLCDLKDVSVQITDGPHNSPNYEDSGIPMIDSKNINNAFKIDDTVATKFISKETDFEISKRCKPQKDDVLISSRGSIGKVAIVTSGQNFNIMGNIILIRTAETLLPKFLLFYLFSQKTFLEKLAHGSSQKGLYLNQIRTLKIPIPPIKIQQQIVNDLETYQKIIDGCRQIIENYKPTIDIDSSWEEVELGELVVFKQGIQIPKEEQFTDSDEGERFLRIVDFTQKTDEPRFVRGNYSKYLFSEDDVALVRYGASVGHVCFGLRGILANNMFKVISQSDKLETKFLKIFMQSSYFQEELSRLSYGAAMPALNFSIVGAIKIFLPSIEEQHRLAIEYEHIQKSIDSNLYLIEIYTRKIQERISKVWGE